MKSFSDCTMTGHTCPHLTPGCDTPRVTPELKGSLTASRVAFLPATPTDFPGDAAGADSHLFYVTSFVPGEGSTLPDEIPGGGVGSGGSLPRAHPLAPRVHLPAPSAPGTLGKRVTAVGWPQFPAVLRGRRGGCCHFSAAPSPLSWDGPWPHTQQTLGTTGTRLCGAAKQCPATSLAFRSFLTLSPRNEVLPSALGWGWGCRGAGAAHGRVTG